MDTLFRHDLVLSMDHRSCQDTASEGAFHALQLSSGYVQLLCAPWEELGFYWIFAVMPSSQATFFTIIFPLGCRGVSWGTASPSFFPDFGIWKAPSLPCSHSSLQDVLVKHFLPFLKYPIPKVLSASLTVSAAAGGSTLLEPTGIDSVCRGDSCWCHLKEATPVD